MKKLFFLLTFAFCMFLSSATFAANEAELPVIEKTEINAYYVTPEEAEDLTVIVCDSDGVDLFIDDTYIGRFDCVVVIL
ncbi:MAG: hypothetical protein AAGG75_24125 [Bacteroidota bacterium]